MVVPPSLTARLPDGFPAILHLQAAGAGRGRGFWCWRAPGSLTRLVVPADYTYIS